MCKKLLCHTKLFGCFGALQPLWNLLNFGVKWMLLHRNNSLKAWLHCLLYAHMHLHTSVSTTVLASTQPATKLKEQRPHCGFSKGVSEYCWKKSFYFVLFLKKKKSYPLFSILQWRLYREIVLFFMELYVSLFKKKKSFSKQDCWWLWLLLYL